MCPVVKVDCSLKTQLLTHTMSTSKVKHTHASQDICQPPTITLTETFPCKFGDNMFGKSNASSLEPCAVTRETTCVTD